MQRGNLLVQRHGVSVQVDVRLQRGLIRRVHPGEPLDLTVFNLVTVRWWVVVVVSVVVNLISPVCLCALFYFSFTSTI